MKKNTKDNKYWQMDYINSVNETFKREMKATDARKKKNSKEKPQSK